MPGWWDTYYVSTPPEFFPHTEVLGVETLLLSTARVPPTLAGIISHELRSHTDNEDPVAAVEFWQPILPEDPWTRRRADYVGRESNRLIAWVVDDQVVLLVELSNIKFNGLEKQSTNSLCRRGLPHLAGDHSQDLSGAEAVRSLSVEDLDLYHLSFRVCRRTRAWRSAVDSATGREGEVSTPEIVVRVPST